jgi:uncharacterized coiled-coil protein SlyX
MSANQTPEPSSFEDSPELHARLIRLEEAVGFADHATQQMSGEMIALHKRLESMAKRIEMLEGRLKDVASSITAPDTDPARTQTNPSLPGEPDSGPSNEELIRNKPPHSA